jgi:hypothetical protein
MAGHAGFLEALESLRDGKKINALLDELRDLHIKKAQDYGTGEDPFLNVRSSVDFGIPPWLGVLIRANDKWIRLKKYARVRDLANESAEDSMIDMAAYALIALALHREGGQNV